MLIMMEWGCSCLEREENGWGRREGTEPLCQSSKLDRKVGTREYLVFLFNMDGTVHVWMPGKNPVMRKSFAFQV